MKWSDISGHAPGYSRVVEAAAHAVTAAEQALGEALRTEYPLHARVLVVHSRGAFYGWVSGWNKNGSRVFVFNENSGKSNGWWAAQVEVLA